MGDERQVKEEREADYHGYGSAMGGVEAGAYFIGKHFLSLVLAAVESDQYRGENNRAWL